MKEQYITDRGTDYSGLGLWNKKIVLKEEILDKYEEKLLTAEQTMSRCGTQIYTSK
jgi:hypothetical protein